jgi:hypothetical protein
LEVRRNFFSNRVVESWNQVPSDVKNARNAGMFKRLYRAHREGEAQASPAYMER